MKWRDIKGYDGIYRISDTGIVESLYRKEISRNKFGSMVRGRGGIELKSFINTQTGYLQVELNKDNKAKKFSIHRLVYEYFVGDLISGMIIHHVDENKRNNTPENLKQITHKEHNNIHKHACWATGLKLSENHKDNIKNSLIEKYKHRSEETYRLYEDGKSNKEISKILCISERQVRKRLQQYKERNNVTN